MTIRMYLFLLFATVLAFAGIARAEEATVLLRSRSLPLKRYEPLELKKFDIEKFQKYLAQPRGEYMFQVQKVSEEEVQKLALEKFLERAAKSKLNECMKVYYFDYFAWASAGNSLFFNSQDPVIQREHEKLYHELRAYMINGGLTQRVRTEYVAPETAAYCEAFASAQADVISVQIEGVHAIAGLFGDALTGFAKMFGGGTNATPPAK